MLPFKKDTDNFKTHAKSTIRVQDIITDEILLSKEVFVGLGERRLGKRCLAGVFKLLEE